MTLHTVFYLFDVLQMTQMPGHELEPMLEPKK